jgi:hypothetical protein
MRTPWRRQPEGFGGDALGRVDQAGADDGARNLPGAFLEKGAIAQRPESCLDERADDLAPLALPQSREVPFKHRYLHQEPGSGRYVGSESGPKRAAGPLRKQIP